MASKWNRRDILKGLAVASTSIALPHELRASQQGQSVAAPQTEIQITPITPHTFRLSILSVDNNGVVQAIPFDGSLVQKSWGAPIALLPGQPDRTIVLGNLQLAISVFPFTATLTDQGGKIVQRFAWDHITGNFPFLIGDAPLFGLGEGGAQFDRRGIIDLMKSG
jgi:alpha-glucosidase/alpha-D-xyloside xylohydrolase